MSGSPLEAYRLREYPERPSIYLNSASYGLLPRSAVEEVTSLTRRRNHPDGIPAPEPGAALRRARSAAGRLLSVPASEVALVPNTSFGINLAAALVGAGPPGRVVVSAGEFPANVLPWLALEDRGFRVTVVPLRDGLPDEDRLLEEVASGDVRALSVSAVQFATGYRSDLESMGRSCRASGTLFVVDAIQALGTLPLAPAEVGVDVLATGGQKWLCGPWGSGFAWVDPRHRAALPPPVVSWLGVEGGAAYSTAGGYALEYLDDARRFEPATLGVQDYLGMAVAVEGLLSLGLDAIRDHILELHRPVLDWADRRGDVQVVTPRDPARRGGVLALRVSDPHGVLRALDRAGIHAAVREELLRLAPHLYIGLGEMERTVDVLDGALGPG